MTSAHTQIEFLTRPFFTQGTHQHGLSVHQPLSPAVHYNGGLELLRWWNAVQGIRCTHFPARAQIDENVTVPLCSTILTVENNYDRNLKAGVKMVS